jgi:hypothetical protein
VAVKNDVRTVWLRDRPLPSDGRVSWSSEGVQVLADSARPQHEIVRYRSSSGAGRILFARLDWPGYTATVDGKPVEVSKGPAGLVAVEGPAGDHVLVLAFETPGLQLGVLALGVAAAIVALQTLFDAGFSGAAGNGRARMFWIALHRRRR